MERDVDIVDENGELIITKTQLEDVSVPKFLLEKYTNHSLAEKLREMKDVEYNDGDVLICSYPKTGTHWLYNLIKLLLYDGPIEESQSFMPLCLEGLPTEKCLQQTRPRVIHSHSKLDRSPTAYLERGKIILLIRNPKDTAVSMYHFLHRRKVFGLEGKWDYFVRHFLTVPFYFGTYPEYLQAMEKIIRDHKDLDIHVMYYEDMKKNSLQELRKVQKHLGLSHSDERLQSILDRCTLKRLGDDINEGKTEAFVRDQNGKQTLYRKGEIGDWKNLFTVAQSEAFDAEWEELMKDSTFHFQYT